MTRALSRHAILASLLLATACSSAEDQAAKARIFSPEDPPKVLLAAAETLDPLRASSDGELLHRIVSITGAEAQARLGPHVQRAKVKFRWTSEGDGKTVGLEEERFVAVGNHDDFHVRIENDERQGMEWLKADGVSYARSRYAPFRERRRDRGSSEHVLASAYATLEDFHALVHGAIRLEPAGNETVGGRPAVKFKASLGPLREPKDARKLPPVEFPKGGPDADTVLRLAALKEGRPTAIAGTLVLDAATAVPIAADLRATVEVPEGEGRKAARLELSVDVKVSDVGATPKIAVPDHIEDAPRPPGVVATLRAYGFEKEKEPSEERPEPVEPPDED